MSLRPIMNKTRYWAGESEVAPMDDVSAIAGLVTSLRAAVNLGGGCLLSPGADMVRESRVRWSGGSVDHAPPRASVPRIAD
jgi:hypothetical protein